MNKRLTEEGLEKEEANMGIGVKTIAVVGNPNSGKSTLINGLAGSKLKVGNWPGVTIEKKEAFMEYKGKRFKLVDLPGTYSLKPFTEEENIVEGFLLSEKVDVILNIIDGVNFERSLGLTLQLMELGKPIVLALNMMDEVEGSGMRYNLGELEELLNVKVVPVVASKKENLKILLEEVNNLSGGGGFVPKDISYGKELDYAREETERILEDERYSALLLRYPKKWLVYKLLEGDMALGLEDVLSPNIIEVSKEVCLNGSEGMSSYIAGSRKRVAHEIAEKVLSIPEEAGAELTERLDKVILSRVWGPLILLFSMFLLFQMTFGMANPFIDWVEGPLTQFILGLGGGLMGLLGVSEWLKSLVMEGVIGGAGTVLTFAPLIFFMMFFITFFEGSGYMARVAFLLDGLMQRIGLHGKAFIPMLLGFGCNVGGIYAVKTLETRKDKILTALIMPFMSCSGRLPVYLILASIFFVGYEGAIAFLMYLIGLLVALLILFILKRVLFKGSQSYFIMELPPYRIPTLKYLLTESFDKTKFFVTQVSTWIVAAMIIVWAANNLPWDPSRTDKSTNLLGIVGTGLAHVTSPLGFGVKVDKEGKEVAHWESGVSLMVGVLAKELVVGSLGQLYGEVEEEDKTTLWEKGLNLGTGFLDTLLEVGRNLVTLGFWPSEEEQVGMGGYKKNIESSFSPLSAFVYLLFTLLYMPCVVTAIAYKSELGSWKWFLLSASYSMALAWGLSFIVYRAGLLLGFA